MISPETEAMFVERFLQREATSKRTIAIKAEEKERGHDWVVPTDVVGCTEIIAVCRHIEGLEAALVDARQDLADTRHRRSKMSELHLRAITRIMERANKAEDALAEALKVIAPLMKATYLYAPVTDRGVTAARNAASAFAAKHGGRE